MTSSQYLLQYVSQLNKSKKSLIFVPLTSEDCLLTCSRELTDWIHWFLVLYSFTEKKKKIFHLSVREIQMLGSFLCLLHISKAQKISPRGLKRLYVGLLQLSIVMDCPRKQESPSLEVFKRCADWALWNVTRW